MENTIDNQMLFSKKDLKKLIIPLMIEQTLALTVGMIDTIMVASISEEAVSGVSLVETINVLLINLFTALATGGAIVSAQYLGGRDKKNSSYAAKQLVLITFLLSTVIMCFCLLLNGPILSFVFGKADASVMSHASIYFYVTALSYPFIALFNAAAALFRSMGNSRKAMINALIMNGVNIVGNALFIYVFRLDVFGAALSTLISRIVAALTMMWMLRNPSLLVSVRDYRIKDFDFPMIKRILRIGIPNGMENSMFQLGKIMVASLVAVHGTTAIAANAVSNSLAIIEIIPGYALGMAMLTVVAQCVGAKEYKQADTYIKYLMKLAYISMITLNIVMLIILKPVLGIYQLSSETFTSAFQIMVLHGFGAMIIWPASFTLPNAFRAAGDVRFPMIASIISMWVFRIGLSYLLAYGFHLGVLSVWIAMMADWIVRSTFFLIRWRSGRWRNNTII